MAALVNALDNYTPTQLGENGHVEYGWSNNIQEKIVQLSFQLTRTSSEHTLSNLSIILHDLIKLLKQKVEIGSLSEKQVAKGYLCLLYKKVAHTRDIIDGKGEYTLSYMMVYTWYKFYPSLAFYAIRCFVSLDDKEVHPYGSWKDLKYFCEYCKSQGENLDSDIIQYCIHLINNQIREDFAKFESSSNDRTVSLASKWTPREKSSFGWLYESLATNYFKEFLKTAKKESQQKKAVLKCKTEYRKIISALNRYIDTLQIKQCSKHWSQIDFNKVTSISLSKQKKAFLNIKHGEVRYPNDEDRVKCAEMFRAHIEKAVKGEVEMKGKRVSMADFTKLAIQFLKEPNPDHNECDLLNSQWCDNATQTGALGKMIAMVDVSGSMDGDPLYVAIALGIRISEKSLIGNRVMTFSHSPSWVNLDQCDDFISKVKIIKEAEWGMNTNFYAALDLILNAIIQKKMSPEDVQDMVLVILSDMQMDYGDNTNKTTLYETMEKKYAEAGIRVHGKPYKPPHILFWNLRSTSGFPTLVNQKNCSMMSGFSPALLNLFCDQGMESLQSCTPWSLLNKSLENDRYKIMGDIIEQIISI